MVKDGKNDGTPLAMAFTKVQYITLPDQDRRHFIGVKHSAHAASLEHLHILDERQAMLKK